MKTFEKFHTDLLNNKVLSANEKVVYIICKSFELAPRGCRISHKYLMDRTKIKTRKTLIKCLDRLTMFGMLARKQIDNSTCHYVFDKTTMQEYINHNINKRRRISLGRQKSSPQINPQIDNVINILRKDK
jgi:hypothetical protein